MWVSVLDRVHSIAEHQPHCANRWNWSLRLVEHVCVDGSGLIHLRFLSGQGDTLGAYCDGDGTNLVRGMAPTGDHPDDYGTSGQMGIRCVRLHRSCNDGGASDTLHVRSKAAVEKPACGPHDERQQEYDDGSTRRPRDADGLWTCMKKTCLHLFWPRGFKGSCLGEEFHRGCTVPSGVIQINTDNERS